ncbi:MULTISPECIES: hypothetical protein [unclassified Xanthobacter]|uniref:hypothetical protein n=1 Tax=unclassified Xanthobacter TaxID=2623496 RepID=UPI001F210881|nr:MULTISPECIES: hypothetical protein [unclassified Xanthobacter]
MSDDPAPRLISRIGRAIYGETWMGPLSRDTGIRKSTIDDWDKGRCDPPAGVYNRIIPIAQAQLTQAQNRAADIQSLIREIKNITSK